MKEQTLGLRLNRGKDKGVMQKAEEPTQGEILRGLVNDYTTEKYIVSYIDFLGTKDRLCNEDWSDFFKLIYGSYRLALTMDQLPEDEMFGKLCVQTFSDNILICSKVDNKSLECIERAYLNLFHFLKVFLGPFIKEGFLFRGGLTMGELYIDSTMVWGQDLVKAVILEESVANYPRVVVSEKLINTLLKCFPYLDRSNKLLWETQTGLVLDFDGMYFVDFADYLNTTGVGDVIKGAQECNNNAIKKCIGKDSLDNEKKLQKLKWQETYLNRAMKKHQDYNTLLDSVG